MDLPHRILIFGNSGAGKSTLAQHLAQQKQLAHLDLDTLAWQATTPPTRRAIKDSASDIQHFCQQHSQWVIEGCYADLLALVTDQSTQIIFLNPGIDTCIAHCRKRPWEPHKYSSPAAQNKNLNLLINWINDYPTRQDEFSLHAHQQLFNSYPGEKIELTTAADLKQFK